MITKEKFIEIIALHQNQEEELDRYSDIIQSDNNVFEFGYLMFDRLLECVFTEEQIDCIYWWLYERMDYFTEKESPYYIENNEEFYLHTPEDLWNYIQTLNNND